MKTYFTLFLSLFWGVSQICGAQTPQIRLQTVASGLTKPIDVVNAGSGRLFVAEAGGKIKIIESNGSVLSTPFLQIPADKLIDAVYNGVFSLAFHPNFASNGYFYVFYNQKAGPGVVARFTRNASNPNIADLSSEVILKTIPFDYGGHRGGKLLFGPDGYLYIFIGDDGNVGRGQIGDVLGNAQNLQKLYGKILRIDVNSGSPYGIPPTNPYLTPGDGIPDEIWASGLRNPWRSSFDRQTGDLWLGDNGQDGYEEVDFVAANGSKVVPAAQNFGWRCYEGAHSYVTTDCNLSGSFVVPQHEFAGYTNNGRKDASVLGGYVYRGSAYPALQGWYVYGDYAQGKLYLLRRGENNTYQNILQTPTLVNPVSFGEGYDGELYVITFLEGSLYRITTSDSPVSQNRPPVAPSVSSLTGTVGKSFTTTLPIFTDPDGNPLTYRLIGSVAGLTFVENTRIFSGTPTTSGPFSLTYTASDGISSVPVLVGVTIAPAAVVAGDYEGYLSTVDCGMFSGWVWDRNKPNAPLTVEFLDGATIAAATLIDQTQADQFRQDLLTAGKGNGNHGYRFTTPESLKNNQKHTIWARVQGTSYVLKQAPRDLTCAGSPNPPTNPPTPPANQKPVAPVVSSLAATKGTQFMATLPTFTDPDSQTLTHALIGLPASLTFTSAYRTITGNPAVTGSFSLTYSASDSKETTTTTVLLTITNPPTPPGTPTVTGDFDGFLDKVECGTIRGWVWDRNKPNTPLTVEFYTGNTVWGTTDASVFRQDLKDAGKGNGAHAYSFTVPIQLKDNVERAVSARILGSAYVLKGSPKALKCAPNARISADTDENKIRVTANPNPVERELMIEIDGIVGQKLGLKIVNMAGQIIFERQVELRISHQQERIDLLRQKTGIYLLQVNPLENEKKKVIVKILKQ
jgi:glucose/arabinose dehydrogenase